MKNLLEFILINLVQYPESILIDEKEQSGEWVYTVTVHPDDVGRVIGRGGSVISAIRQIAKVRAMKENTRVRIIVADVSPIVESTAPESATPTELDHSAESKSPVASE